MAAAEANTASSISNALLAEYLEYLRSQRKLAPLTCENYQRDLGELIQFKGEQDWAQLRSIDIRKFAAKMHAQGLNPRSIARKLSSWRGWFAWLAHQGKLDLNPVDGVRPPKRGKPLPKALSVEQAVFLVEQSGDSAVQACNAAMFELLYSSGLRVSELVSLDLRYSAGASDDARYVSPGWVDFDEQMVQVLGKGGKTRAVPVGKAALQALHTWLQYRPTLAKQDDSVDALALFVNQHGRRISVRVLQMRLQQHAQKIGMDSRVHPHMLRHSFASHVLQSSGDLRAVQDMLGHASISSTQVYTALDFQHLAQVYDAAHPRAKKKEG
ncbi:MAG: tyrosine recombinase XerC [Burkholderiales bacterium]|nr:tyrosine recombinase XerC [Burkholderiales bacterium]